MQGAEWLIAKSEEQLKETFRKLDEISYFNQVKVIKAFHKNRVALRHFSGSTGYGYGDEGRDTSIRFLQTYSARRVRSFHPISFRERTR